MNDHLGETMIVGDDRLQWDSAISDGVTSIKIHTIVNSQKFFYLSFKKKKKHDLNKTILQNLHDKTGKEKNSLNC